MNFRNIQKFIWVELKPVAVFLLFTTVIYYPWVSNPAVNCEDVYGGNLTEKVDEKLVNQCEYLYNFVSCDCTMAIILYILMMIRINNILPKILFREAFIGFTFITAVHILNRSCFINKVTEAIIAIALQLSLGWSSKRLIEIEEREFDIKTAKKRKYAKRPTDVTFHIWCANGELKTQLFEQLKKIDHPEVFWEQSEGPIIPKYVEEAYNELQATELPPKPTMI